MKNEKYKFLEYPLASTLCGLLLHLMDWLTIFRLTRKGPVEAMEMQMRMFTNRISASIVMIAAVGIFLVRKRLNVKQCSSGGGLLMLWGLGMFAVAQAIPKAEVVLNVLGLPIRLFAFITEFLQIFGSQATGFMLEAPAIIAPALMILFLIGRKNEAEENKPYTLRDTL